MSRRVLACLFCLSTVDAVAAELTVNTLLDGVTPGDGQVTLREAILAANADITTDLGQSGSGADRIRFGALAGTLSLASTLPPITSTIELAGPGASTLRVSNPSSRVLVVDGGRLSVRALRLSDGVAQGGKGGDSETSTGGGGGAAGIGGVVLLRTGALFIEDAIVDNGAALGGRGGTVAQSGGTFGGGGGGGLGGDGAAAIDAAGGSGGAGGELGGSGGGPGAAGGPGAGGGGGSSSPGGATGGAGGFGAGGGGGGRSAGAGPSALGGAGGFGGGGGGRGGGGTGGDGPGATDPAGFGGAGGASTGNGAIAGAGGGGAAFGGCIAALGGVMELARVDFTGCLASGAFGGNRPGIPNRGARGRSKGGAIYVHTTANAVANTLSFLDSSAVDGTGSGWTPGVASDTVDVFGTLRPHLSADGFESP